MAYPAEFLEELKKRSSITDVINSYVPLKREGNLYKACCPFHNEKTPSFVVYSNGTGNDEHFYCYGCGAGGDVITFVMKADNLDYASAVEALARRAGLSVPADSYNKEAADKRRRLLEINREAARFFSTQLLSGKYPQASEYIRERGLDKAAKHFGLGYCPPGRKLFSYLTDLGYRPQELQDAFLCNRGNYDIFENRITFPVIDVSGNVIAFSARSMEAKPADGRKYINTNDTAAYNKRKNLFALNFAKNSREDFFILCEGQIDVITLHMAGFTNALASLGTAFSEEMASLLHRYKNKVVVCYDGDSAGISKTETVIRILTSAGIETKVVTLPGGCDPDEYIKKYGKDKFSVLLSDSIGHVEYSCGRILAQFNLESSDQKVAASDKLADFIAALQSPVEREVYTVKYAKQLDISKDSFGSLVAQKHNALMKKQKRENDGALIRKNAGYGDRVNPDKLRMPRAAFAEEAILGIAQINPDYLIRSVDDSSLCADDFKTSLNKRIYAAMLECVKENGKFDISLIADRFTPDEIGRITRMKVAREELSDNSYEVFCQNAAALRAAPGAKQTGDASFDDIQAIINKKKKQ